MLLRFRVAKKCGLNPLEAHGLNIQETKRTVICTPKGECKHDMYQ